MSSKYTIMFIQWSNFFKQTNYATRLHDVARRSYKAMSNGFYIPNGGEIDWPIQTELQNKIFHDLCT